MVARNALAVAAGTVVLALCAFSPARAQSGSGLFEQGVESYRSGSYAEAQRLLREYVEANADRRDSDPARLGEAYHHLGLMTPDPKLAEGYFLAVVQRYPTTPVADESLARLGELYTAKGEHAEARRQWQALGRDYPLSRYVPEVDLQVGQTYFAGGDLEPAYSSFSAGFAKMKGFQRSGGQGANLRTLEGDYVYWLGRTLLARGAYGDARKYLNLVLLDYPDHPLEALALYHVSEAYRQEGKEKDARSAWLRFSEAVRNTSLEPVAENPNLVAIARARLAGDLASRSQREAANAAVDGPEGERTAAGRAELGDKTAGAAERRTGASDMGRPTYRGEPESAAESDEPLVAEAGDDEGFGPAAEARPAPSENEGLRAPEPGRPGGVVANEPLGRRVEAPAPSGEEGAEASEMQAAADDDRAAEEAAAAERAAEDRAREAQVMERAGEVARADEQGRVSTGRPEPLPQIRPEGPRLPEPGGPAGTPKERILAGATERPGAAPKTEAGVAPGDGPEPEDAPGAEPAGDSAPSPDAAAALEPIPPGSVYLQAGAFTNASSAAQLSTQLRKRGFEPQINTGLVEGQAFYRVRFGPFEVPANRPDLEAVRERLKKAGFEALVRRAEGSG